MAPHELRITAATLELAKKHGFSPTAPVVPSVLGVAVPTGLTQQEFDGAVDSMLEASQRDIIETAERRLAQHLR
jgi:hypothetical protein